MPKRAIADLENAVLVSQHVTAAAPLVYREDGRGSYYMTNPALKWVVEGAGGSFQASINSKTTIVVLGDTAKDDEWALSKKQLALHEHQEKAAAGTRAPLKVLSLRDFAREYHLEDAIEPELLWAFTHTYNAPPPEQRKKNFLSIGHTCVAMDYEKSIGVSSGYSRGRYNLHYHGEWPEAEKLVEMHKRYFKPKQVKVAPPVVD